MQSRKATKRLAVVGGGLTEAFAARLREACGSFGSCDLLQEAATPDELLDAAATVGGFRPLLVVLAGCWLKEEGLNLLVEVRRISRGAIALSVGSDLGSLGLGHALRFGLRGLVEPTADPVQLSRTLAALAAGEVWMNRKLLVEAVEFMAPDADDGPTDVWLKLPTLTERERAVLLEALEGGPNKVIARKLDISEQTVKIHLMHVYRKLGVNRRVDLLKALSLANSTAPRAASPGTT